VSEWMRRIGVRLAGLVSRAVVSRVDDGEKRQLVQLTLLEGETREGLEHFQPYGFTSVPQVGAEAVALFVGGERDHGLVVAVDDRRYRLTGLQDGEVALYTDQGDKLVLKRGGTIEVTAATKVVVDSPLVELAGNTRAVAKGEDLNAAIVTLGNAIAAAVGTIPPVGGGAAAGAAITTAVGAFQTAAASALSTKVKLG
jgi:phage baseplate assembly protein V